MVCLNVSFFLADALPIEALPTGLQREEPKPIAVSSGEGMGASLPGQKNVKLDCRLSLFHQTNVFATSLQSTCHTLSLS